MWYKWLEIKWWIECFFFYKDHSSDDGCTWLAVSNATVSRCLGALSRCCCCCHDGEVDDSDFVVEGDDGKLASLLLSTPTGGAKEDVVSPDSADVCVDVALYAWIPWSDTIPGVLLLFCVGDGTLDVDDDDNGGCCDDACPYAYAYISLLPLLPYMDSDTVLGGIVICWCCKDDDDGRWWWWQCGGCVKATSSMYTSMLDTINHENQENNKEDVLFRWMCVFVFYFINKYLLVERTVRHSW